MTAHNSHRKAPVTESAQTQMHVSNPSYERRVDDVLDTYVEWREECLAARQAYHRWTTAPDVDAALAFAAFRAALDREERAASVYRGALGRLDGEDLRSATELTSRRRAAWVQAIVRLVQTPQLKGHTA